MNLTPHRILVADDNYVMADVLRFNLQQAGFEVRVARDGVEAWDMFETEDFDHVVTDYQMPHMDGEELIRNIRSADQNSHVPIILLSAKGLEFDRTALQDELRLSEVMFKPFSPRQVVQLIQQHLADTPAVPCTT